MISLFKLAVLSIQGQICLPDLRNQSRLRTLQIEPTIKEVDALLPVLPFLLNLEELEIFRTKLDLNMLLDLGSTLSSNKNLKKLGMMPVVSVQLGDFLDILDLSTNLEQVTLDIPRTDESMCNSLFRFIKDSKRLPSLTLKFWGEFFSNKNATSLIDALEGNSSFLRFVLASHECKHLQEDSVDRLNEMIANHPFLESVLFYSWNKRLEVMKPLSSERRIDAYRLIRQCRILASCRAQQQVKNTLPFEVLEKIFVHSSVKSESWDPKKLRVIVRCLLSKRTIGKIFSTFDFSAESLYWACKRAEELI